MKNLKISFLVVILLAAFSACKQDKHSDALTDQLDNCGKVKPEDCCAIQNFGTVTFANNSDTMYAVYINGNHHRDLVLGHSSFGMRFPAGTNPTVVFQYAKLDSTYLDSASSVLSVFDRYSGSFSVTQCSNQTYTIPVTFLCSTTPGCADGIKNGDESYTDCDTTGIGTCNACPSPSAGQTGAIVNGCLWMATGLTADYNQTANKFVFSGTGASGTSFSVTLNNMNPADSIGKDVWVPLASFGLSASAFDLHVHDENLYSYTSASIHFTKYDTTTKLMSGTFKIKGRDPRGGIRYLSSGKFNDVPFTITP